MSRERKEIIARVSEACVSGARQSKACACIGISAKTLQRWCRPDSARDGRLDAKHDPRNKLTELERLRVIKVANELEYADLPPSKIVPKLADKGIYIASESTFYRILKAANQLSHRQKAKPTGQRKKPPGVNGNRPESNLQLGYYLLADSG